METTFQNAQEGSQPFEISTDEFIPAIQLASMFGNTLTITNYVYPYFLLTTKTKLDDGTFELTNEKRMAVPCRDIYTEEESPTIYSLFHNNLPSEYSSTEWFCMPAGSYKVWNDALVNVEASMPSLGVDYCYNMDSIDPTFDSSGCITDEEEAKAMLYEINMQTKVVNKHFNPNNYLETGEMGYKQANPMLSYFSTAE